MRILRGLVLACFVLVWSAVPSLGGGVAFAHEDCLLEIQEGSSHECLIPAGGELGELRGTLRGVACLVRTTLRGLNDNAALGGGPCGF